MQMGLTEDLKLRFVAWLRENKDVSRVRGVGRLVGVSC